MCVRVCAFSKWECTFLLCSWIIFFIRLKMIFLLTFRIYNKNPILLFEIVFLLPPIRGIVSLQFAAFIFSFYFLFENKCCYFFFLTVLCRKFFSHWLTNNFSYHESNNKPCNLQPTRKEKGSNFLLFVANGFLATLNSVLLHWQFLFVVSTHLGFLRLLSEGFHYNFSLFA